ncbi:MAG: hypothetical protein NTNFB02_26300 [Nitrospira sp.]
MMRSLRSISTLVLVLGSMACTHAPQPTATAATPEKVAATNAALRDLWVGHIFGIRNVAVATMDKNTAAREIAEKGVVANAEQIAGSIEPFYGKPASDKLFALLAGHYGAIRDHLDATAAGNTAQQAAAVKALSANAGEIAAFLSGANPYLPKDAVMGLLMTHAAHHIQQFQQLKVGEYAHEAETWKGMKQHMYLVADTLTSALARQFPEKF